MELRQEIERRRATMIVARPLHSDLPAPSMEDPMQDTLPFDMSPLAKSLEKKFRAEDERLMKPAREEANLPPVKDLEGKTAEVEAKKLVVDGKTAEEDDGCKKPEVEKPEVDKSSPIAPKNASPAPTPTKPTPMKEDAFFEEDNGITREQQLRARDALANRSRDSDEEDEQPCFKKPAGKSSPKAKAKAGAKPKGRAKAKAKARAKPKGRAKAKAKACAKPKARAKAKAKGRPAKKKAMDVENENGGIHDNDEVEVVPPPSPVPEDPAAPAAMGQMGDSEPEELEAQAGKRRQTASSAGPKKRAKAMAKKKGADEKEDMPDHGEGKKTFARRYMPATDLLAKRRWCALKNAFELHIQPGVYFASSLEASGGVLYIAWDLVHFVVINTCPSDWILEACHGAPQGNPRHHQGGS